MAKVYGIHTLTLKPGVKVEDFEKFVSEDVNSLPRFAGFGFYICKGDKGERDGKYIWMFDFESVETRVRFVTGMGVLSEEGQQYFETLQRVHGEVLKKWNTFVTTPFGVGSPATDYVVVGK